MPTKPKLVVPSVRTSERSTFKRCQQRWWWSYVDGLKPKREKNPLWFGTGIHLALAQWYQPGLERGRPMQEVWLEYCADEERMIPTDYEEDELKYVDARELGVEMLQNYVEQFGDDPDWEVLVTEQAFRHIIRRAGLPVVRYLGTLDGVYRNRITGEIWIMEHKTAAQIILTHLPLDDQAGSYCFVAEAILRKLKLIGPNERVAGIMYNFLRKAKADTRPRNADGKHTNKPTKDHFFAALDPLGIPSLRQSMKLAELEAIADEHGLTVLGEVSASQPSPLFIREPTWRSDGDKRSMEDRVVEEVRQREAVRTGVFNPTKTPTKDCSWDCDFFRMCQLHESGDDWEEYRDMMYKRVDPYEDHRRTRKAA